MTIATITPPFIPSSSGRKSGVYAVSVEEHIAGGFAKPAQIALKTAKLSS
jgi:hypothetical protein